MALLQLLLRQLPLEQPPLIRHFFVETLQSRYLKIVTVIYLLIPNLIFLLGWVKWYWCLPVIVLLLSSTYSITFEKASKTQGFLLLPKDFLLIAIIALFATWYAGVGGFTGQVIDYEKHHAVSHDLILYEWPVIYNDHQYIAAPVFLDYYLAWYLPPALMASFTDPTLAELYVYLWSSIGLYLALCWFVILVKSKKWWVFLMFFFIADLESSYTIVRFLVRGLFTGLFNSEMLLAELHFTDIIFNNFTPNYASHFMQFEWAPQHTLGGMLSAALILDYFFTAKSSRFLLFLGSLTLLWSPFIAIGLLPFIGLTMYKKPKDIFSMENILSGGALFLIIASYYLAHFPQQFRWIWDMYENRLGLYKMPLFIVVKFGLLMLVVYPFIKRNTEYRQLFWTVSILLSIFPLIYIGYQADFTMRASSPSWFVWVFLVVIALKGISKSKLKYVLVLLVVLSSLRYVFNGKHTHKKIAKIAINDSKPITQLYKHEWFNTQYFGVMDSFFMKYLAKGDE